MEATRLLPCAVVTTSRMIGLCSTSNAGAAKPGGRHPAPAPAFTRRGAVLSTLLLASSVPALLATSTAAAAASDESGAAAAAAAVVYCRASVSVVVVASLDASGVPTFLGSGVVWAPGGYIVTAYKTVEKARRQGSQAFAVCVGYATYPAEVLARDPGHEIAVLRVTDAAAAEALPAIALGSSADLRVGQDALLLGADGSASGGVSVSLSAGVVSALGRAIPASNGQPLAGVLQTDVNLVAGSLGGALVDSSARLIGIPVTSYTKPGSGRSSGVSFALEADVLRAVVPRLIAYGNASGKR